MRIGGMYTIDFARVSKIPKFSVTLKKGDSKRTIGLILLQNGQAINLDDYTVTIAAKKSDGNDIFNDVKIIDAENGICEVEVTKQMSALDTDLPCEIVLYGADGTVASSSNFVISKISSVRNEESIVSSSEFTSLTKALTEVKNIDHRFKEVDSQIKEKAKRSDLETTNKKVAAIEINKAEKNYVDAKVGQIVSGSPKGNYPNLSALQVEKPTGDTGIYITTDNGNWNYWNGLTWVSGGVYQSSRIGDGQVTSNTLDAGVLALLNNKAILGSELAWESGSINSTGLLVENTARMRTTDYIRVSKGVVSLSDYNNYKLLVITYDLNKNLISYSDFKSENFIINIDCYVKLIIAKVSNASIIESEFNNISSLLNVKTNEYRGDLIKEKSITFDKVDFIQGVNLFNNVFSNICINNGKVATADKTTTKCIVFPIENQKEYTIYVEGNHNRFIIDLADSTDIGTDAIRLNFENTQKTYSEFRLINTNNNKYLFMSIAYGDPLTTDIFNAKISIYNSEDILINNEKVVRNRSNSVNGSIIKDKSLSIDKLNFEIGAYSNVYTSEVSVDKPYTLTSDVYSKYDELLSIHSEYITMNPLGADSWGNEIREYIFKTPNYNSRIDNPRSQSSMIKKPKILIITGIHGDERSPVLGVFKMLKDLCEMKSIDKFANLREAIEIRIIPVAVPTGYNGNKRLNDNNVNINRNFTDGWVNLPVGSDYAGLSPASEKETQIIEKWLNDNVDAKYFMDIHNSGYDSEVTWISIKEGVEYTDRLKKSYFKFVNNISRHWREDFGLPTNRNIGYSGSFDFAGAQRFGDFIGIPSMTPEISWLQKYTSDTTKFGSITNAMTTEFIGNLLLELCSDYI